MPAEDWQKYFKLGNRTTFEGPEGLERVCANPLEELYQMIKARLAAESVLNIFGAPADKPQPVPLNDDTCRAIMTKMLEVK